MQIKGLQLEDYNDFKKCSMYVAFPSCTFKCERECGVDGMCHNHSLISDTDIEISLDKLYDHFYDNPVQQAVVCAGMEPFDSFKDLYELVKYWRIEKENFCPIVIYTGYNEDEVQDKVDKLKEFAGELIIKFGRFIPGDELHYDEVLGVNLASKNQYAKLIS